MSEKKRHKHFILDRFTDTEKFLQPLQAYSKKPVPSRDRKIHGEGLLKQIEALKTGMVAARKEQEMAGLEGGFGLQLEFSSFPDVELAFERLARERSGIELLNVRHDDSYTYATVFVPDGKLEHFEKLVLAYIEEKRDRRGHPRDNKVLVDTIQQIHAATLRALWTDDPSVFPTTGDEIFWWEVWLPIRSDRSATNAAFRRLAAAHGFQVASGELLFPERSILLVRTSSKEIERSMMTLNSIAELRRAKETADFFDALAPAEQSEWMDELLDRCLFSGTEAQAPYVCLLDTGVNNGHPLLDPALSDQDLHTINPAWGTNDANGHGTGMAGLALMGDLTAALASDAQIVIGHRLESVKLLQKDGGNDGDSHHYGYLTTEAISRPEVTDPYRRRVFHLAVTASDDRDRGRPSSWSATVDALCADLDGDGASPRLLLVSAGNIRESDAWATYPYGNSTDGIHDPAQAWNALTVGAYTNLTNITEPDADGYKPIAATGGLSPFSTTSSTWESHWPLKPDVLFEGGNAATDGFGAVTMPSLSLLTCCNDPGTRLFTTASATSAATALCARMAAQIMATYPDLWPETVRGLIVHSAEWTDNMRSSILCYTSRPTKNDYAGLVRHCGFGVPNLDRALWSISNSLTMLVETHLNPFRREGSQAPTLRDMHLHRLPWPLKELEALGETQVEMRVTLSYFVEPNPSRRDFRSRYRYESHGLRFEVKRPLESENDFRSRINAAARDEEEGTRVGGTDTGWLIGKHNRHKGSLHSDIWVGNAVELASRGTLAVYPALGWWKTRHRLGRYDKAARYALIVSIHAPEIEVDLYNAVANQIATPVMV